MSEARSVDGSSAANLAAFLSGLSESERALLADERAASAQLLSLPNAERALAVAGRALSHADQITHRHLSVVEPKTSIACRAGCHWCCHLKVSLTAPEVFWIAAYLRDKAPPSQLSAALARTAELAKDPRIFSSDAKAEAHIPCALLTAQGACSVHAVRPLTCRGYTSTDAEVCRRMLHDDSELVTMNEPLARELAALGLGLLAGIASAGLAGELLELTSALYIALHEPDALPRWLAGEPVFRSALSEQVTPPSQ